MTLKMIVRLKSIMIPKSIWKPVGQATVLTVPRIFFDSFGWTWYDNPVKATIKTGASYENWGKKNHNFFHGFSMDSVGMHFIPSLLSDFLLNCGLFKVTEKYITNPEEEIDADWIYDCRGRSEIDYTEYQTLTNPLNAVVLGRSEKVDPTLIYTRCVATPDGWTFVIQITTALLTGIFITIQLLARRSAEFNLRAMFGVSPTKTLNFKNYRAKSVWSGEKTILNGNRYGFIDL